MGYSDPPQTPAPISWVSYSYFWRFVKVISNVLTGQCTKCRVSIWGRLFGVSSPQTQCCNVHGDGGVPASFSKHNVQVHELPRVGCLVYRDKVFVHFLVQNHWSWLSCQYCDEFGTWMFRQTRVSIFIASQCWYRSPFFTFQFWHNIPGYVCDILFFFLFKVCASAIALKVNY